MSEEEVRDIWARQYALAKEYLADGVIVPKGGKLPELWPGYGRSVRDRARNMPHIEGGHFADELFAKRAPNQSQEEFDYIKDNYRQTTLPVFADVENTVARVWSEGNWGLDVTDEELKEYIESGINEWGSIANFMRYALPRLKLSDPMGLLVTLPQEVPVAIYEDGTETTDPDVVPEPVPSYYQSGQVWGFEYDKWYLIRLNSHAALSSGRQGVKCWLIDKDNVWLIEQQSKRGRDEFSLTLLYAHGCGEPPCAHLMGVPSVQDGHLLWLSPFSAARELLDIALADEQNLQVVKVRTNYPQRVLLGDECTYSDPDTGAVCNGGTMTYWAEGKKVESMCPSCKGNGKRSLGPMKDLVITPRDREGSTINATNALAYVSPSTDTARFSREDITWLTNEARKLLHLNAEAPMAGGDAKTATQSGLDNRAKDAFVKTIADQVFYLFGLCLRYTAIQRRAPEDAFELRKPVVYDMRTIDDRLAEVNAARAANMPFVVVARMADDAARAMFRHSPTALDELDATMRADRLAQMSDAAIGAELAAGRVQPWEMMLHYNALGIYAEAMAERDYGSVEDLAVRMQEIAQGRAPATDATSEQFRRVRELIT